MTDTIARDSAMVELALSSGEPSCMLCGMPADLLVMHDCGAPGGPACVGCWTRHAQFMDDAQAQGQPYCRYCDKDIDVSHVYAVTLSGQRK